MLTTLALAPLTPRLAASRDDIRQQLQQLRLTADDLQECLMVSEVAGREWQGEAGGWVWQGAGCGVVKPDGRRA